MSFCSNRVASLLAAAVVVSSSIVFAAQPAGSGGGSPSGLDSLSDDRLMAELAQRGLDSLLERSFEVNKVPADQRQAMRSLISMRELRDPKSRLTQRQRDELVARVVAGMERTLETQRDPKLLIENAEELIRATVFRELNTLEYWGDSTATTARLRPVATTVSRMLARAAEVARKQADDLANRITDPNDQAALDRYAQIDKLANVAEYTRRMNDYAVVASMDPVDGAARDKLADETAEYLRQFDNPDSGVQPVVRLQIGKVLLAKGDAAEAVKTLDSLWAGGAEVTPAPSAGQRFEARYFAAVAQIKAGNTADAAKRLTDLRASVASDLEGTSDRGGAEAALMMLEYRLHVANKDDAAARASLVALVRARPEFEGTVLDQLAGRLPEKPDLKSLDPLMLRAVFRRGEIEQRKPEGQSIDETAMNLAVDAGRELLSRRGQPGVELTLLEGTGIMLPLLLDRQGRRLEAADALLSFIDAFGTTHRNAAAALDEATYLVASLRREKPEDAEVAKVYERLLSVAVSPPFSKMELAYEWARRLQQTGRYAEAVRFFELVPPGDSREPLARFFRMVAIKQLLDESAGKLPEAERKARVGEVLTLADRVSAEARQRIAAGGGGGADERNDKLILVRTALVGADVALRAQKDPARALRLLEGFESAAAGLASERELTSQAMNLRVLSLMDQGKNQEATRTLVTLLERTGGNEGADIVFNLLTRLNDDFDRARAAGEMTTVRSLARARAELSGFLVTWAQNHPDAKIKELTPRYRIFDAETKRLAADLETDPAAREAGLRNALALYEALRDPARPDANVDLGIALTSYELGQYDKARDLLAILLNERRLGRPTLEEDRNGETVVVQNDRYWEATVRLMSSTLKLVDQGKADPTARSGIADGLKALYARWGQSLGGPKWAPEFEKLRQQVIPDYAVPDLGAK